MDELDSNLSGTLRLPDRGHCRTMDRPTNRCINYLESIVLRTTVEYQDNLRKELRSASILNFELFNYCHSLVYGSCQHVVSLVFIFL